MQSRFKYRAWDKRHKEYAYDVQNGFQKYGHMICETVDFGQVLKDDELELEQCTGLKDKNEKLIYEGDIVRVDSKVYYIDPLTLVVGFHNGAFMVGDRFIDNNSKFMEIIGNIHENPELLEDNNVKHSE